MYSRSAGELRQVERRDGAGEARGLQRCLLWAEQRELHAGEIVIAEELDLSGCVEPCSGIAVARCGREQRLSGGPQHRRGDWAGADAEELCRICAVVADEALIAVVFQAKPDAVAVSPGFTGVDGDLGEIGDRCIVQNLLKPRALQAELLAVGEVLMLATAADAKVRTARSGCFRRAQSSCPM